MRAALLRAACLKLRRGAQGTALFGMQRNIRTVSGPGSNCARSFFSNGRAGHGVDAARKARWSEKHVSFGSYIIGHPLALRTRSVTSYEDARPMLCQKLGRRARALNSGQTR